MQRNPADIVADPNISGPEPVFFVDSNNNPTSPATEGGNLAAIVARLTSILADLGAFADTSASGTLTNDNDTVSITCPGGQATSLVQITGNNVGTLLFEASPDAGTTWYAVNAVQVGASSVAPQTTTTGAWRVNVSGFTNFRVRLHPTTSGTASIKINLSQGVHNVAVTNATALGQAAMVNSAPVVIASDQSAVKIKADLSEQASLSAGSLNADLVPSTDISAYAWWSVHITGTFTGDRKSVV